MVISVTGEFLSLGPALTPGDLSRENIAIKSCALHFGHHSFCYVPQLGPNKANTVGLKLKGVEVHKATASHTVYY